MAILTCFAWINRESDNSYCSSNATTTPRLQRLCTLEGWRTVDLSAPPCRTHPLVLLCGSRSFVVLVAPSPRAIVSLLFPLMLSPLMHYPSLLSLLQSLSIPINIAAKLPQIIINTQLIAMLQQRLRMLRAQIAYASFVAASSSADAASSSSAPSAAFPFPSTSASGSPSLASFPPIPKSSLSALPFALNFGGSFSRLYTTVTQLGGDKLMLLGFAVSCVLNLAILAQCSYITRLQRECTEAAALVATLGRPSSSSSAAPASPSQ